MVMVKRLTKSQICKLEKMKRAFCKGFGCKKDVDQALIMKSFVGEFGSKEEFARFFVMVNKQEWLLDDPKELDGLSKQLFSSFYLHVDGFVFFDVWHCG